MKTSLFFRLAGALLILAFAAVPAAKAQLFSFNVDLNTTTLSQDANAPYYLDFQLLSGSSSLVNTVSISNFQFTNGSPTGSAFTSGGASGSLAGTVTLNDAAFINELYQAFSSNTTDIKFTVTTTEKFSGLTPTGFNVAILDSFSNPPSQILTTDPQQVSLVKLAIDPTNTGNVLGDVKTYQSDSSDGITPAGITATVSAIPEPPVSAMVFGASALAVGLRRMRRKAPVAVAA